MRWEGFGIAVVGMVAAGACDGPGGGGGGVPADAQGSDTVFVSTDVTTDSGGDANNCVNGARRCSGQVAQQCVNGAFQDLFTCPSTQICEAGACKASETSLPDTTDTQGGETVSDPCAGRECGPNGQGGTCGTCAFPEACNPQGQCVAGCTPECGGKDCGSDGCGGTCGTCAQFEQCVQGTCEQTQVCDCAGAVCGLDNCGNSCGTCTGQTTCQGGLCVSTEQGGNCTDLIDCIYGDTGCATTAADDAAFQACADTCYTASSQTGIDEFEAYLGCLQACPQPDGDPATTDDDLAYNRCSYQSCSDVEAYCVLNASGSGTCLGIFDCFDTCADGDSACYQGCYEAANPAAQAALWGLNACVNVECPDPNDATCVDNALADQCSQFVVDCQTN